MESRQEAHPSKAMDAESRQDEGASKAPPLKVPFGETEDFAWGVVLQLCMVTLPLALTVGGSVIARSWEWNGNGTLFGWSDEL